MFNEKEYKDIVAAIKTETKELQEITEERHDTSIKAMKFLTDLFSKAVANKIPYEVSKQGYAISQARINKIDEAHNKASKIADTLYIMREQLRSIDEMYLEDKLHRVAFDARNGMPRISVGFTEQDAVFYKQRVKRQREKLDQRIVEAQQIILDVREHLPETEIHFNEDMFSEETISKITGEKLKKFVDENIEQEEQETVPVNDITEETSKESKAPIKEETEDKKTTFFAKMKTFLTNTATTVKNMIVSVAKKVKQEAINLKEKFFAKLKSFLTPKVA